MDKDLHAPRRMEDNSSSAGESSMSPLDRWQAGSGPATDDASYGQDDLKHRDLSTRFAGDDRSLQFYQQGPSEMSVSFVERESTDEDELRYKEAYHAAYYRGGVSRQGYMNPDEQYIHPHGHIHSGHGASALPPHLHHAGPPWGDGPPEEEREWREGEHEGEHQGWGEEGTGEAPESAFWRPEGLEIPWEFYPPELGPYRPQNGSEFNPTGAPRPNNETFRLQVLRRYNILDSDPDPRYDRITALACQLFHVPVCLVSLVDESRQWFKSNVGLPGVCETDRESSFCAFTLLPDVNPLLVVRDATQDTRFSQNKLVVGAPFIRFYAGAPLVTSGGFILGSFCIIDFKPRPDFNNEHESLLQALASLVSHEMEKHTQEMELQRVQAEKFEEDKKGLLLAIDAFSEGLVLVDVSQPGQPIVFVNEGWERITGYSIEDVVGMKCGALLQGPLSDASAATALGQAVAEGESTSVEILNYKKDGTPFWNWVRIRPVPPSSTFLPSDQNQRYYFGILSDCSLRKEKEMQLENMRVRELEKEAAVMAKRQFVANLSHEIRTPMNAIIACSQLLADSPGLTDDQQELVQMVSGSGQQLLSLISDILDFSKLEANKMSMHDREFSIWGCLDFCMEMLVLKSQTKGLDLAYNVDPSVPRWIWADEVRLRQILTNLLSNAAKFTDEGGEVEVSVTARLLEPSPLARGLVEPIDSHALLHGPTGAFKGTLLPHNTDALRALSMVHHRSQHSETSIPLSFSQPAASSHLEGNKDDRRGRTVSAEAVGPGRALVRSHSNQQHRVDGMEEKRPLPLPWSLLPEYEIRFTVRDTGIGMPKDFAAVIFEAFTQCDNSRSRRYEGTGLGMAIAKDLTERMGGRIWVESEVGRGSTFYFTIRAHGAMGEIRGSTAMAVEHAFAPPQTPLSGMRALLVGPTETFQRMVGSMLASWGMQCTGVRTADEFWQQWRHQQRATSATANAGDGSGEGSGRTRSERSSMREREIKMKSPRRGQPQPSPKDQSQALAHQEQRTQYPRDVQGQAIGTPGPTPTHPSLASPEQDPHLPEAGIAGPEALKLSGGTLSEMEKGGSRPAVGPTENGMDCDPPAGGSGAAAGPTISKPPLSGSPLLGPHAQHLKPRPPGRTMSGIPMSSSVAGTGVGRRGSPEGTAQSQPMARGTSLDQALEEQHEDEDAPRMPLTFRSQSCGRCTSPRPSLALGGAASIPEDAGGAPGDSPGGAGMGRGEGSTGGSSGARQRYFDVVLVDCPILSAEAEVPDKHMAKFVMEYEAALLMMHLGCACATSVPTFLFLAKHTKKQTSIDPARLANVTVLSRPVRVNQVYKALSERLTRARAEREREKEARSAEGAEAPATEDVDRSMWAPGAQPVQDGLGEAEEEETANIGLSIMIAEDNIVNQRVLLKLLNGMGYPSCATANNGLKVLEHFKKQRFDLILMDLQMPEMDGITATMQLRKELFPEEQPIVAALTADVGYGVEAECLEAGMNWYLSKPIRKEALEGLLEKCKALKRSGNLKAAHLGWLT